jgi:NTE family protein
MWVGSLVHIAERTFLLSMSKELKEKEKKFDMLVAPPELTNYKILDPEKAEEVFDIGYRATLEKLKNYQISTIISKHI